MATLNLTNCTVDQTKLAGLENNLSQAQKVLTICEGGQGQAPRCGTAMISATVNFIEALNAEITATQNACNAVLTGGAVMNPNFKL